MSPSWRSPRPGSSPDVPKRDDEITRPIGLPSAALREEVYARKSEAEVKMAFATCQQLRRELRTAIEERDEALARCGELVETREEVTMETLKHIALYQLAGAPAWVWVATLVGLPVVNEIVQRSSLKAQSLYQAVGNAMKASPLYLIPLVKQLADIMATPVKPAVLPPDNPTGSQR